MIILSLGFSGWYFWFFDFLCVFVCICMWLFLLFGAGLTCKNLSFLLRKGEIFIVCVSFRT